ncbi:response regulator [Hymenobacter psychrophilus]|uniref:cAMP-binding domain of CRP or a regulatory subunit of cAMP-dependent protein kinases n=1 Tax=Hymenobacter psychrophilus TaxID=651662 RepID=A0A1H3L6G8_9BACT|nr:response regulator [Hymenobacter psychrophilus]SDY59799.1 cAMP-binding domain of CRP or a regulatory subunit of cAMP-dependent protein kinases [Hymenobacter psychrophilus]
MDLILLIEDHQIIRENTAQLLELAGYTVQTAENGELGVELALENRPDLVVCDIMMPVLDGYGVLQIFNQHPQLTGVPFIFLTAKTDQADRRRGMALGADDYLSKPFEKADLLSAVSGRLSRFQHLRPAPDHNGEQLHMLLDEAQQTGDLASLSLDRKAHLIRRKQDIYLEGDEAIRLYFVQSGRVKTVKTTAGGKELIVGLHGPGEFFGYLPLLQHTPHRDSAIAVDEAELLYIPKDDFMALLLRNPAVGQQFVQLLAGQVSGQAELLLALAYSSIRRRVADTLVQLHEQQAGTEAADAGIQFTRDDMAAMVGTAPESLSRTLNEFKHDGLVELTPNTIRVLEPEKLRQAHW